MQRLPSEFVNDCSSAEYTYLKTYYRMEPFGTWRDNFHAAQITQILANVNRAKRTKPYKLADFFFRDAAAERNQRHQSFFATFKSFAKKSTGDPSAKQITRSKKS